MRSSCSLLVDSDVITDFSARANQRGATKTSGHDRPEPAVTIDRNQRSRSTGISGHDRPESAVTMNRNQRSRSTGIPSHVYRLPDPLGILSSTGSGSQPHTPAKRQDASFTSALPSFSFTVTGSMSNEPSPRTSGGRLSGVAGASSHDAVTGVHTSTEIETRSSAL